MGGRLQGYVPEMCVRRIAQSVMVAWGESMLKYGVSARHPERESLRVSVSDDGAMVGGSASLQRARALFSTQERLDALLREAGRRQDGTPLGFEYRIKKISLLDKGAELESV